MPLDSPDLESAVNRSRMRRTYAFAVIVEIAVLAALWWLQTTFS
jgi:hypothetical protein